MNNGVRRFVLLVLVASLFLMQPAVAQVPTVTPTLTFNNPLIHPFGQHVLHRDGWDRYLMYFSINSAVRHGKPVGEDFTPGDSGTYNTACHTWWADRIWLTWSFGDGKDPSGWNQNDGYGNTPPILLLNIGGQDIDGDGVMEYEGVGEQALIGDPYVVYWNNQWHMYYEGTSNCDTSDGMLFHATADHWFGPWIKRGPVNGLLGSHANSGLAWATVLLDEGNLYLYYTDGNVSLRAATASDTTGQNFVSQTIPVIGQMMSRGHVVKVPGGYKLIYDLFVGLPVVTEMRSSFSMNRFSFPVGVKILSSKPDYFGFSDTGMGLPTYLKVGNEERVYFTGHTYSESQWPGWEVSQICVAVLGTQIERLSNGGFETITANTNTAPDGSWMRYRYTGTNSNVLVANSGVARSGADSVRLGVNNSSSQTLDHVAIVIPANATSAILSFWLSVATSETGTTATDTLSVKIANATGTGTLGTVLTFSNRSNPNEGYFLKAVDVTRFRGQTVRVRFIGANNSTRPTEFRIDDVSLTSDE
ncbi:MAG: hypothetical protein NUW02_00990 [Candidatus Campbellbacteria bacterium]|nr:hypothetical protein [Candidatus Campbellbacteria bacterium]